MLRAPASRRFAVVIVVALIGCSIYVLRDRIRELALAHALVRNVRSLRYRVVEGRFSDAFEYRQRVLRGSALSPELLSVRATAEALRARWESGGTAGMGRRAGVGLLVAGETDRSAATLVETLQRQTGQRDVLRSIGACDDPALLTDFSAAILQRSIAHENSYDLLLAFESADRAWRLEHNASAAWNRATAADRMGVPSAAAHAWQEVLAIDRSSSWSQEVKARTEAAVRAAAAPLAESYEGFFHRKLVARLTSILADSSNPPVDNIAEVKDVDPLRGDHLALDTLEAVRRIRREGSIAERERVIKALASYTRGRDAFEDDRLDEAHAAFTIAEAELKAFHIPFALMASDQRIRVQCSKADQPRCLEELQLLREETRTRYPWLSARCAYARGQTFYRRGRIYEAAEWFQRGHDEVKQLGDSTLEGLTHLMLANAYAAAGETDVALEHYIAALRQHSQQPGDRRRRQVEDVVMFALRHDFIATAELLLDERRSLTSTDAGRVIESTLHGIAAIRRGDTTSAARHFEQSHRLLTLVKDPDEGANARRSLAIAEAESQIPTLTMSMEELNASIAEHEHEQLAIWLPQLLAKRGALFEARNQPERAESDYRRAIEILEEREPRIDQSVLSLGVANETDSPFDRLIRMLLAQQKIAGALSIAERASSRRISALHARSVGVRDVFDAAHRSGDDGVAAVQKMLDDYHVAVVQYLLRDELVTWVIASREIRATRRAVRAAEITGAIDDLRTCVPSGDCGYERALEIASNVLIGGWIARVPRGATLLIQPPGELQAVPFAMLKTGQGELLLSRNAITTAPTLRAFVHAATLDAARTGETRAFFAASPDPEGRDRLPMAASEVTRASQFYTSATVVTHTTRAIFLDQAPSFSVVHFAGHVIVNDEQPLRSAMVFDRGDSALESDVLQMHELDERLFGKARLVVLSGCETGRAPRPTMSIANALLSQSVPSVVYTSWPVEDEAAEQFAREFHRSIATGRSRADAVRDAQLAVFKTHPGRPDWWAAFALAGASGPLTH